MIAEDSRDLTLDGQARNGQKANKILKFITLESSKASTATHFCCADCNRWGSSACCAAYSYRRMSCWERPLTVDAFWMASIHRGNLRPIGWPTNPTKTTRSNWSRCLAPGSDSISICAYALTHRGRRTYCASVRRCHDRHAKIRLLVPVFYPVSGGVMNDAHRKSNCNGTKMLFSMSHWKAQWRRLRLSTDNNIR